MTAQASMVNVPIKGTATEAETVEIQPRLAVAAELVDGPPQRTGTVAMNVRFPPEVHHQLRLIAFASERPISEILLEAVQAFLVQQTRRKRR